jgi:plasmid stabilization system protein ParE
LKHKVRLSDDARSFLQREARYLRERSPSAAEAFLNRFREARRNLSQFPELGRRIEALPVEGSMRLVVGDYVLDYDLDDDVVAITTIRHGRQLDPDLAKDDDFDFEAGSPASTSNVKP